VNAATVKERQREREKERDDGRKKQGDRRGWIGGMWGEEKNRL